MKKINLLVTVTLIIIIAILAIDSYQTHKSLSVYKRGEQARISIDAAREINNSTTNDTAKIMNLQCQGWNK